MTTSVIRGRPRTSEAQRFWSKVDQSDADGCWLWKGYRARKGYGHFKRAGRHGRIEQSHRVAWELTHGRPPDDMYVLHRCDNPPCNRPDHLFLGTLLDNAADCVSKSRQSMGARNGRAKISEEGARVIRELRREGVTLSELSRRFGIDKSQVSRIVRNEAWTCVA
ncbi:MAG: HNH endonuclease [Dehalococcoidia bacterium]